MFTKVGGRRTSNIEGGRVLTKVGGGTWIGMMPGRMGHVMPRARHFLT